MIIYTDTVTPRNLCWTQCFKYPCCCLLGTLCRSPPFSMNFHKIIFLTFYMHEVLWDLISYAWLTFLTVMISGSIHIMTNDRIFCLCNGWSFLHFVYVPHFLFLFANECRLSWMVLKWLSEGNDLTDILIEIRIVLNVWSPYYKDISFVVEWVAALHTFMMDNSIALHSKIYHNLLLSTQFSLTSSVNKHSFKLHDTISPRRTWMDKHGEHYLIRITRSAC